MGSTSAGPSVASLVASQCLLKSGIAGIAIHHCSQIFFYKLLTLGHRFWCETSHESCPHGWVQYIPPIFGMRGSIHYPGRRSPCLNTAYFVGRTPGVSSSHIRIFVLARGPHWRMRQNFTPKLSSASKGGGLELRVAIFTIKRGAKKLLRVSQLDGQRTTHFSRYMPLLINSINYDMFGVPKFDPFPCMRRIDEFLWQFLRIQWWGDHVFFFLISPIWAPWTSISGSKSDKYSAFHTVSLELLFWKMFIPHPPMNLDLLGKIYRKPWFHPKMGGFPHS